MKARLTTSEFARALGIKPESIRSHVYRHGAYYGIRPVKGPNRRLLWPADSVERLLDKEGDAA